MNDVSTFHQVFEKVFDIVNPHLVKTRCLIKHCGLLKINKECISEIAVRKPRIYSFSVIYNMLMWNNNTLTGGSFLQNGNF